MNIKTVSFVIGLVLAVIAGTWAVQKRNSPVSSESEMVSESGASIASSEAEDEHEEENEGGAARQENNATNGQSSPSSPIAMQTYLLADVSRHASQSDCWTAINGKVYDVTTWIKQHPGGAQAIISLCDGGEKRPANELSGFYIGDLK